MIFLRHPVITAFIGAILFGVSLSIRVDASPVVPIQTEAPVKPESSLRDRAEARTLQDAFKGIPLEAQAVVVWDAKESRVVFGRKETAQLPLASLTKLMLAYTANQVLTENTIMTVTAKDLAEEGSSGISAGESFRYADLRAATLVASLNDTANSISRTMGETLKSGESLENQKRSAIDLMNSSAKVLGLEQTYFYNEDGLDLGSGQPGALGSATDVARIFSALIAEYPESIAPTREDGYVLTSQRAVKYQYWNTNQEVDKVPGIIGSKTGYTALADGNLAIAFSLEGHTLVIVVLGSSKEGRFKDVHSIVEFLTTHSLPKLADAHDILAS
jgi:D-alanyl-D-alanine carboxypeptidase